MKTHALKYVLVTPARNEEALIEQTIQSVIHQTLLPQKWVIVSDGSTDHTDEIVQKFLPEYPWIELVQLPPLTDRHFASKARSFAAGFERLRELDWEVVGNLDADITFGPGYLNYLMTQFASDPALGVAGTPFVDAGTAYDYRFTSLEHVSGACQLFRRQCYEQIGGYQAVRGGGIDWIAVTTARMKGWKTRTFLDQVCHHHRPMGTASRNRLRAAFKLGEQDYYLGGHPLFQIFRGVYQMSRQPLIVGGGALIAGYFLGWLRGLPKPVSHELISFHRKEQTLRLKHKLRHTFGSAKDARTLIEHHAARMNTNNTP